MLQNFKIPKTGNVFITSDTHFNHNKDFIFATRGYSSIAEHDRELIRLWNSIVGQDDTVFHLGDFVANDPTGEIAQSLLASLNGHKYLLWGNHKSGVKQLYKNTLKQYPFISDNTELYPLAIGDNTVHLGDIVHTVYKGTVVNMCHYPLAIWEDCQNDSVLLCGHSHAGYPDSKPFGTSGGKILDVGIDVFGCPILLSEAIRVAKDKPTVVKDNHIAGL